MRLCRAWRAALLSGFEVYLLVNASAPSLHRIVPPSATATATTRRKKVLTSLRSSPGKDSRSLEICGHRTSHLRTDTYDKQHTSEQPPSISVLVCGYSWGLPETNVSFTDRGVPGFPRASQNEKLRRDLKVGTILTHLRTDKLRTVPVEIRKEA